MRRLTAILWLVLAATSSVTAATEPSARAVFDQLKALGGTWQNTGKQSPAVVNYTIIANGSSLIETWTMSPTKQSMTV